MKTEIIFDFTCGRNNSIDRVRTGEEKVIALGRKVKKLIAMIAT